RPLLHGLKWLERDLGRVEDGERWGPRRIDFDILLYGDQEVHDNDLIVPHPRLRERAFALVPLVELAPRYRPLLDELPPEQLAGVSSIS
ncbi:MAG TPA: 2-amino-4-hydroxy-6-hydroxymethyldihydropteridine diphosphokinase, partial [Candidatus Acidoferrum sp.]|nr:2-amino-4-hydroxy-6-hydroxymethyldihydropteridine diphosphokinase [Candidatus Acidoferrum sp.]